MTYDDPFKYIRNLGREFDVLKEVTRNPIAEINRAFREQQALFKDAAAQITDLSMQSSVGQITARSDRFIERVGDPGISSLETIRATMEAACDWARLDEFSKAVLVESLPSFQDDLAQKFLEPLQGIDASLAQSLSAVQEAVGAEIRQAVSIRESLPALMLEEQIGQLISKLEIPTVAAELEDFRESIAKLEHAWSPDMIERLGEIAGSLHLPYLNNAALQWSVALQGPSIDRIAAMPLLRSSLTSIVEAVRSENLRGLFEQWEQMFESEQSAGRKISPAVLGLLLNLLLFILGILHQASSEKAIGEKLDQLRNSQVLIEEAVELDSANEESERKRLASELAGIRQALEDVAEEVRNSSEMEATKVQFASENLPLRTAASLEADVILVIPQGQVLKVLGETSSWCQVRAIDFSTGEAVEGWVASKLLLEGPSDF